MMRLSGRFRSALIIGLQGIRSRKTRTLLSMVSLFLGVLAVVVVQAGASIAERALLADMELQRGIDGTKVMGMAPQPRVSEIIMDTVPGRDDAVAVVGVSAIIGEPGVRPVNPNASPFDEIGFYGMPMVCDATGNCREQTSAEAGPEGQAIEVRLTALTGDIRQFKPFRPESGQWLDFGSMPMMAPRLVLNKEAVKGFERYKVPAEMRVPGASANMTPQLIGVVDDGDYQPRAYVRMDEMANWIPATKLVDPSMGEMNVLMTGNTPVEQVLTSKLKAINAEPYVELINSRKDQEKELALMRLIFLSMAGLVLLIGVAGILNVGLATVGERVEEFALRRAVGTPRALLAGIVLAETLITGLLTAALAIGVSAVALKGVVMVAGNSEPFLQGVVFPWDAGVAGVIAGLIAGVLGGFVPAVRAAGIPIATVMRA
ncbi:ABC transporter permease [Actinoplanes hulinensis]|uniref:ABC transporter permease n=1 Tax=Actinoplanes hulinensis TaxID=1144547 RepID=A0ABS7B5H0_9ACTN|nr:ABC transporter permease [Actinoplanes hulinensis]MBW6436289.1 ABC transporter permease [Actinoplanes hulinensis]